MPFTLSRAQTTLEKLSAADAHSDDRLDESELRELEATLVAEGGIAAGYTSEQLESLIGALAYQVALKCATWLTNFEFTYKPDGVPHGVEYNKLAAFFKAQKISPTQLTKTFAGAIITRMVSSQQYPAKWAERGFKAADKYYSWPGANAIPEGHKFEPTAAQRLAINTNKDVLVERSSKAATNFAPSIFPEVYAGFFGIRGAANPSGFSPAGLLE